MACSYSRVRSGASAVGAVRHSSSTYGQQVGDLGGGLGGRAHDHELACHLVGHRAGQVAVRRAGRRQRLQRPRLVAEPVGGEVRVVLLDLGVHRDARLGVLRRLLDIVTDGHAQERHDAELIAASGPARARPRATASCTSPLIQRGDHTGWPSSPSATSALSSTMGDRSGASQIGTGRSHRPRQPRAAQVDPVEVALEEADVALFRRRGHLVHERRSAPAGAPAGGRRPRRSGPRSTP